MNKPRRLPNASAVGLWQQTQTHGPRLLETTEHAQQHVSLETTPWDNQRYAPQAHKAVSMDGAWRMCAAQAGKNSTSVWSQMCCPSTLPRPSRFICPRCGIVGCLAMSRPSDAGPTWMWRLADNYFPCAAQVVDWYQHLVEAAQARLPHDQTAAQRRSATLKTHRFKGAVHLIIELFER